MENQLSPQISSNEALESYITHLIEFMECGVNNEIVKDNLNKLSTSLNQEDVLLVAGRNFRNQVDFKGWEFRNKVEIIDTIFQGGISFAKAFFARSLTFRNCFIAEDVDFIDSTIREELVVIGTSWGRIFLGDVKCIQEADIAGGSPSCGSDAGRVQNKPMKVVDIHDRKISFPVKLSGVNVILAWRTEFEKNVSVQSSRILTFPEARFRGNFYLKTSPPADSGAISEANFTNAEFNGFVQIDARALNGLFSFEGAKFNKEFRVVKADVEKKELDNIFLDPGGDDPLGNIDFRFCLFESQFDARDVVFRSALDFSYAIFNGALLFDRAKFEADLKFQAIVSERPISMAKCGFREVPDFRDARLTHPLIFNRIWPGRPGYRRVPKTLLAKRSDDASERFDALARIASQLGDAEWEQEFVARGFQAARKGRDFLLPISAGPTPNLIPGVPRLNWRGRASYFLGWIYQLSSDFGRSLWRPLIALILLIGLTYLTLVSLPKSAPRETHTPQISVGKCRDLDNFEAFVLAVRSGFFLLDWGSESSKPNFGCYDNESLTRLFSVGVGFITSIEKLIAGVLWVLFGMAIRFRLRIR